MNGQWFTRDIFKTSFTRGFTVYTRSNLGIYMPNVAVPDLHKI